MFATDVLAHLNAQLASARRLLQAVLLQGTAIRARDVQAVVGHAAAIQAEMDCRTRLDADRAALLRHAGSRLGLPAHEVTLEALGALLDDAQAALARERAAELRGLLAEIGREHHVNRALLHQELAFLGHLLAMVGAEEARTYSPERFVRSAPATALRALDTTA
jgi:hypothetical protein